MKFKVLTDTERKQKLEQVQAVRRQQGVTIVQACAQVDVSEASYYQWRKKFKTPKSDVNPKKQGEAPRAVQASKIDTDDGKKILEVKAMFPHMGTKQLRLYLIKNHKITYSFRQIRQFLEFHDVPKMKAAFPPQPVRRFERNMANEMWQVDIMNFFVGPKSLYLISFLDDHSRFIVTYQVADNQSSSEVLSLLKRAVSFRKPLSILSDRGIQFCSWNGVTAFQLELRAHNIDHLLAREQHPETIGKIEAFHKTIKRELLTTTEFSSIEEAKERIHDYIMFYNFARPHMGIDNQTPAERYFKSLKAFNPQSVYFRKVVPHRGNWNGFNGPTTTKTQKARKRTSENQCTEKAGRRTGKTKQKA